MAQFEINISYRKLVGTKKIQKVQSVVTVAPSERWLSLVSICPGWP